MERDYFNLDAIWEDLKAKVLGRISSPYFQRWFRQVRLTAEDTGALCVHCPDLFTRDWIHNHYGDLIETSLNVLTGRPAYIRYLPMDQESEGGAPRKIPSGVRREMSFRSFQAFPGNRLMVQAARAFAQGALKSGVPLAIQGGPESGKTHLLHAIGNVIQRRGQKVIYRDAREFHAEMIRSITDGSLDRMRRIYRVHCECLILDDIHVLSTLPDVQEEFYFMYNSLIQGGKGVVLASRVAPEAMENIEQGLKSRVVSALKIKLPDYTTDEKAAVLEKRASAAGLNLDRPGILGILDREGGSLKKAILTLKLRKTDRRNDGSRRPSRRSRGLPLLPGRPGSPRGPGSGP